jgi:hypothetical protein
MKQFYSYHKVGNQILLFFSTWHGFPFKNLKSRLAQNLLKRHLEIHTDYEVRNTHHLICQIIARKIPFSDRFFFLAEFSL